MPKRKLVKLIANMLLIIDILFYKLNNYKTINVYSMHFTNNSMPCLFGILRNL